jgi:hypothetical protein
MWGVLLHRQLPPPEDQHGQPGNRVRTVLASTTHNSKVQGMPFQIDTSEGPLTLSDQQFQAVAQHAERVADLTVAILDAIGLIRNKSAPFPAMFLLELGAVLELGLWEQQGLRAFLDTDLPSYQEAAAALAARAAKGLVEFEGPNAAPLSSLVLRVWMENFAWEGPCHLQAEVVVGNVDEDQFAQVLADFVWQHRRELSGLLNKQP